MCVSERQREREEVEGVRVQRSPPAVKIVAVPLITTFLLLHVFPILKSSTGILKTYKFKTIYNYSSYTTTKILR